MAFDAIIEALTHALHQLPGKRMCMKSLIKSITSKDSEICAALANIKLNNPGMRETFEQAALYLAQTCPVTKNQSSKKNVLFDVSIVTTTGQKQGTPERTGV